MANYSNLKNIIDQVVRTNGQGDITGANLNQTLQQMVTDLGANYQYAGVATPSTNPGSPDQNVFYIATLAGTYSYFNSIVLPKGITVLRWNGSWSATTLYTVDTGLTPGSEALVQSGTVFEKFKFDGGPWDVSAHFPTAGPNNDGKFTLAYILTNANTLIPEAWRKGGMSIRFISSFDNKYVEYFLKKNTWSTDVSDWQQINIEDRVHNLEIEVNGGTQQTTTQYSEAGFIRYTDGSIVTGNSWIHTPLIPIGSVILFGKFAGNAAVANVAFYATQELSSYISGLQTGAVLPQNADVLMSSITPPSGANYIAFSTNGSEYPKIEVVAQTQSSGLIDDVVGLKNDIEVLQDRVGHAEDLLDKIEGTLVDEKTVSTPNNGYIDHTGNIAGETSTWKHSDIFPVEQFYSANGFIGHASVSSFAFYGTNEISSADNNFKGYWDVGSQVGLIDKETFNSHVPTGAKYFVCSTDAASATLQLKLVSNVLDDLQSDIEDIKGSLETNTNDIAELKSSVRVAVISNKMLHISFDDTINAFRDLIDNSRTSLFDSPFFGVLKTLHDTYGCVFSCYCFCYMMDLKYVSKITTISSPSTTSVYYLAQTDESYSVGLYVYRNSAWTAYDNSTMREDYVLFSLSEMTNAYAEELSNNSDWIKFGFHGIDGLEGLSGITRTSTEMKTAYDNTISDIVRITGTVESIDMVPRLQGFGGSKDVCRALRDCDCGCLGYLTADNGDTRGFSSGYYLTDPAITALWNKGQWYDYQERLHFYPSSLRLDGQTAAATETYMNNFLTVAKYGQSEMICMFCHENQMFVNGSVGSNYVASLTKVAEWAVAHGYLFSYPMNRIRASF